MKTRLIIPGILLLCLMVLILNFSCAGKETKIYNDYSWTTRIRKDHPRLYINNSSFKHIKGRALTKEKELFDEMKSRIDNLVGQVIEFKEPYVNDGTQNSDHEYGFRAAESAFLYRVLKEEKYLHLTKDLLKALGDYYNLRNEAKLNIQWYAFSRIGTLCAFDWIYDYLSDKERMEIGAPLLTSISDMMHDGKRKNFFRENTGNYKTGFYGPPCLAWYAGLVFYNAGINDELAEQLLKKGYDDHTSLLEYRSHMAGGLISQHRHYDNNNFVIYRNGFRALDTGTRPEPGQHLTHYYCRTVAHNCILINMPGEILPRYWGGPALSEEVLPVPNDGGQSVLLGSEIVAYDENEDYVYIASDATKSYHKDKSELVLRQFLFLLPDHFVIFDRVISSKPEYKKTWLLHTAAEPIVTGNEFAEESGGGKLFCRTLLPENAGLTNKVKAQAGKF